MSQKWLNTCSVLVPFTQNYAGKLHASKVAQLLSQPQKTVARQFQELEKTNLLRYYRDGKNKYYSLDLENSYSFSLLQIVENFKELQFRLQHPEISLLLGELSSLTSVILFGSYAKNLAKKDSDLDLVIFSRKSQRILKIIDKYPFTVNAHFVTLSLFEKRLREKQPLAIEMAKDHIFFGEKERIIRILTNYYKK